jgi:hypothetical protein
MTNIMCSSSSSSNSSISSNSNNNNISGSSKWKIIDRAQDSGFLPTVAVTLWLGWNGFILWIILYAIFLAGNWQRMIIIGLATLSLVLPVDFPGTLGHRLGDWIMLQAEKYFGKNAQPSNACFNYEPNLTVICQMVIGLKTVIEDEDDLIRHSKQNKAIIFAFNPHDMVR